MSTEEEYTLNDANTITKYKTAADISQRVLVKLKELCIEDASVLDICKKGDELLGEATDKVYKGKSIAKGIGFPTCVSVNHIATHYSPLEPESAENILTLKNGDVVKISLGAQIDGFGGILADTIVVGSDKVTGKKADVILAAWYATEAAIRLVKPGNKNWQVTEAVDKIAAAYGCKPLEGMLSHEQKRNVVDGKKQIILNPSDSQRNAMETCVFDEGEVYGIDILMSTGVDGKVRQMEARTTVYKKTDTTYNLKMKASRGVFSDIQKRFGTFPFTLRAFEDPKRARAGLHECIQHELVIPYDVLYEREGEIVAQFFTTIALTKTGSLKLSGPALLDFSRYESEKKITDENLLKLISSPLKPKKKKAAKEETNGVKAE